MDESTASDATIRFATPADVDELARLRWQLYKEHGSEGESLHAYRDRFTAFAHEALARDDWRAWCAEADDRLVAAVWLQTVPRVPAPGRRDPSPIGYLTNMYVEPDCRSLGLGSMMVQELIRYCTAEGFDVVIAFPADEAYDFYERNGFARPPDLVVHDLGR
jgi:GNAT superfamily N-acetyltransferase